MGSYLSIVNDTPNTWQCKVGADEAALKIAGMAVTAIGAAVAVIGTAGAAAPAAAALASGGVSVFGVSTAALATITAGAASISTAAGIIGGVSKFGVAVANGITTNLKDKGYEEIGVGKQHRYGKYSLSLWRQATCVRTYIVDERTVRTETVVMRPIFSGATNKAVRKYEIQHWIDKAKTQKADVVAKSGDKARSIEEGAVYVDDDGDGVSDTAVGDGNGAGAGAATPVGAGGDSQETDDGEGNAGVSPGSGSPVRLRT